MSDNSPRRPDRKLGLIAPVSLAAVLVALILGIVLLRGRGSHPAPPPAPAPAPAPAVTAPPATPPMLTRADLIIAAQAAAARYADGQPPPVAKDGWVGRRFEIRIPFGCEGPQSPVSAAQAFYEFDPEHHTVRLVARPADWTTLPMIATLKDVEAVEGFWIPRPWSRSERCPPPREAPLPATPTPAAGQTLGLAQLFGANESRIGRRDGRAYEQVVKLDDGETPADGYRLLLSGRVAAFPGGQWVRCWAESPDHRPLCLYAVQLDRVAFEAADGATLGEWPQ